jgi:hypothetical protein
LSLARLTPIAVPLRTFPLGLLTGPFFSWTRCSVISWFSAVSSTDPDSPLQLVLWELIAVQCGVLWLRWPSEEPGSRRVGTIGLGILLHAKGQ